MRSLLPLIAIAALVLGGFAASAASGDSEPEARSTAWLANGSVGAQLETTSAGTGSRSQSGGVQTGALQIRAGETIARTDVSDGPTAQAISVARSVSALNGMVTAYGVRRELTAAPRGQAYEGRVTGLSIDGKMIGDVDGARRFELPDGAGTVDVNAGAAGLRILLSKPAGGQPAGTEINVAVVAALVRRGEEAASTPTPTATPKARTKARRGDGRSGARKNGSRRPRRPGAEQLRRQTLPAPVHLTQGGFAFPVYGDGVSIADDFGGPRQIGPHQGNDIFAPYGSPVIAVTDGTLQKVGTLPIAGNRLWLVTDDGEAFFYAHLAAFAELAEDGRRVQAGDVLGFVGNTGDAEPTPPHVHFEIHPRGIEGPAADPHEVLLAWQRREDVAPSGWLLRVGADTSERPGALVEVRDFIAGE